MRGGAGIGSAGIAGPGWARLSANARLPTSVNASREVSGLRFHRHSISFRIDVLSNTVELTRGLAGSPRVNGDATTRGGSATLGADAAQQGFVAFILVVPALLKELLTSCVGYRVGL